MNDPLAGYEAPYFLRVVEEVLDPLLHEHGFSYHGDHAGVTAYWRCGPKFLNVGYLVESIPNYDLLLGVGFDDGDILAPKSSENSIGVWRLLPYDEAPRIANWQFDSEEKLRAELSRAWEEAIVPYALPVLEDEHRLLGLIADHADELTEEDERVMLERLRRFARNEFDAGRYRQAAVAYEGIPVDELSPSEMKRLEIARRRA